MPDQTYFDKQTNIDNLIYELLETMKKTNVVLSDQSEVLTQLVSSGLNNATINIVQKAIPQNDMIDFYYDDRNGKYFKAIGTIVESKHYTITQQLDMVLASPYGSQDISHSFNTEQENMALLSVHITGISADALQAGFVVCRNSVLDSGLGYPWTYFLNQNFAGSSTIGLSAGQGLTVVHKLQFPIIFQWRLNDVLRLLFRNAHVNAQIMQITLEMVRLKEVEL